jgi:hypothetical protein
VQTNFFNLNCSFKGFSTSVVITGLNQETKRALDFPRFEIIGKKGVIDNNKGLAMVFYSSYCWGTNGFLFVF